MSELYTLNTAHVYSSLIVGEVGSFVANITPPLLDYWKVEDIESRDSNKGPHEHLLSFLWKYRGKVAVYCTGVLPVLLVKKSTS